MCYPKPGPRCSAHARVKLEKAKQKLLETEESSPLQDEARKNYREAYEEYKATDEGVKMLLDRASTSFAAGDSDGGSWHLGQADKYNQIRQEQLRKYKDKDVLRKEVSRHLEKKRQESAAERVWEDEGGSVGRTERPLADAELGKTSVDVPGYGTFHKSSVYFDKSGSFPYYVRIEADRDLSDEEVKKMSQLVGYAYRTNVRGESMGDPQRDSKRSFVVHADTTKSRSDDVGLALTDFEKDIPTQLSEGSPVRKTDRSGPGTKGTRLVEGLGKGAPQIEVYYN